MRTFDYEALRASSEGWHVGRNDPVPFVRYLLGTFLKAYSIFEDRVSDVLGAGRATSYAKTER